MVRMADSPPRNEAIRVPHERAGSPQDLADEARARAAATLRVLPHLPVPQAAEYVIMEIRTANDEIVLVQPGRTGGGF